MRACGPPAWTSGRRAATFDVLGFPFDASLEIDWYAGIKPKTGRITWDIGFIYYCLPERLSPLG